MTIRPGLSSQPSKTVNVFDLTAKAKGINYENSEIITTKEKAARITLCVVLTMVVLTAISLLLGEAFGLQWTLCSKPHNRTSQDNLYHWPWNWKHDGPPLSMSETYQERWNTMTMPEKRKELLRASFGEVDLYDVYNAVKGSHAIESDEKV